MEYLVCMLLSSIFTLIVYKLGVSDTRGVGGGAPLFPDRPTTILTNNKISDSTQKPKSFISEKFSDLMKKNPFPKKPEPEEKSKEQILFEEGVSNLMSFDGTIQKEVGEDQ